MAPGECRPFGEHGGARNETVAVVEQEVLLRAEVSARTGAHDVRTVAGAAAGGRPVESALASA
jgi:glycerate kinase